MCKRGIFCISICAGNDGKVTVSELTFFFSVLADFFLVGFCAAVCFVTDRARKNADRERLQTGVHA